MWQKHFRFFVRLLRCFIYFVYLVERIYVKLMWNEYEPHHCDVWNDDISDSKSKSFTNTNCTRSYYCWCTNINLIFRAIFCPFFVKCRSADQTETRKLRLSWCMKSNKNTSLRGMRCGEGNDRRFNEAIFKISINYFDYDYGIHCRKTAVDIDSVYSSFPFLCLCCCAILADYFRTHRSPSTGIARTLLAFSVCFCCCCFR